eukprot:TRINITY_DN1493_c0_g1_i1.p1 TRINITY_DN1493_c0_g1~~TRINITY_DN1493_c0_g1_i1.p1  ORF type:complete len:1142 (+),score=297.10 TRINITY_DN1493_c0_g1_i1:190-3615(+)
MSKEGVELVSISTNVIVPVESSSHRVVSLEEAAISSIPIIDSECSIRLNCLQKEILTVCAHSDKRIFVGSEDTSIRLWDVPKQNWVWSMKDHSKAITCIIVDHKRKLMISGSQDNSVRLWNIAECETAEKQMDIKSIKAFQGHKKPITSLCLDEITGTLFSASEDATVKGWNIETGECIMSIIDIKEVPKCIKVNGKFLYVATVSGLQKRSILTGEAIQEFPTPSPVNALEPFQEDVFIGLEDGSIYSINGSDSTLVNELKGNDDWAIHSIVSHRERLYCGTYEKLIGKAKKGVVPIKGRILILDLSNKKRECLQKLDAHAHKITSLTAFGNYLFSGSFDKMVFVWNLTPSDDVPLYEHEKEVVCTTATGTHLFSSSGKRTITSFDLHTRKKLKEFKGHEQTVSCLVESDGLLFSGSLDKTVRIWDALTGNCLRVLPKAKAPILCLSVSDDMLYVGYENRLIEFYDIQTGELRGKKDYSEEKQKKQRNSIATGMTTSDSSTNLLTSSEPGSPEPTLKSLQSKATSITSMAVYEQAIITPGDGDRLRKVNRKTYLFSATGDTVTLWDMEEGETGYVKFFKNGKIPITLLKVYKSREFTLLLASDKSGNIHSWDIRQFSDIQSLQILPLVSIPAHPNQAVMTMHIDDNSLISSSKENIKIWSYTMLENKDSILDPKLVLTLKDFGKKGLMDVCLQDDLIFVSMGNIIKQFNLSILMAPTAVKRNFSVQRLRKFLKSEESSQLSQEDWRELLYFLLAYGLTDAVKYVMNKKNININDPDDKGDNGLLHAVRSQRFSMLTHLSSTSYSDQLKVEEEDYKIKEFLFAQSRDDNVAYLKGLYKCGVDLSLVSVQIVAHSFLNKNSPLAFLKFWIKSNNINSQDLEFRRTPLHYAVLFGSLQATKILHANSKINVNALDKDGMSPLHLGFLESDDPLPGRRGARSAYQLTADRFDCIQLLLSISTGPKKPEILIRQDKANMHRSQWSAYDLLLNRYNQDRQILQTPKKRAEPGQRARRGHQAVPKDQRSLGLLQHAAVVRVRLQRQVGHQKFCVQGNSLSHFPNLSPHCCFWTDDSRRFRRIPIVAESSEYLWRGIITRWHRRHIQVDFRDTGARTECHGVEFAHVSDRFYGSVARSYAGQLGPDETV